MADGDTMPLKAPAEEQTAKTGTDAIDPDIVHRYRVINVVAVQNWGRSGSTFLQSLLDNHPNIVSTPNFYSRAYFEIWENALAEQADPEKTATFMEKFRQWFDPALVDHTAGLHRLGPDQNQVAGVNRDLFAQYLTAFFKKNAMTRRTLFIGAHLAYALALGRGGDLGDDLWILYPVHGRGRKVADTLLEDFPDSRFIHTLREPVANFASSIAHLRGTNRTYKHPSVWSVLRMQYAARSLEKGFTLHNDFAYDQGLAENGQVCAIRLEDLHTAPLDMMKTVADWLGLAWHPCLLESTFDGKIWWNRPESPRLKGFQTTHLSRNVTTCLSRLDRFRVREIARPKRLKWGYEKDKRSTLKSALYTTAFYITLWVAWRQEWRERPSAYRIVDMLSRVRKLLPPDLRARVDDDMTRETTRFTYLSYQKGTETLRSAMKPQDQHNPVRCLIVLYKAGPEEDGYKGRIYEDLPVSGTESARDEIGVWFDDEVINPAVSERQRPVPGLYDIARLCLAVSDYVSVRWLTMKAHMLSRRRIADTLPHMAPHPAEGDISTRIPDV